MLVIYGVLNQLSDLSCSGCWERRNGEFQTLKHKQSFQLGGFGPFLRRVEDGGGTMINASLGDVDE
jgi:hypothetical protein